MQSRMASAIWLRRAMSSSTIRSIEESDPIHRVDLRVGKIISVETHPDADHLFIEHVDIPTTESSVTNTRTIVSGLAKFMTKETLLNKHVIVVQNMKPSKFRGVLSKGMLLAASKDDRVAILEAPQQTPLGERVGIQGVLLSEPDVVLKPKQRIFEQVAEHMRTGPDGTVMYKDQLLVTSCGPVVCEDISGGKVS